MISLIYSTRYRSQKKCEKEETKTNASAHLVQTVQYSFKIRELEVVRKTQYTSLLTLALVYRPEISLLKHHVIDLYALL